VDHNPFSPLPSSLSVIPVARPVRAERPRGRHAAGAGEELHGRTRPGGRAHRADDHGPGLLPGHPVPGSHAAGHRPHLPVPARGLHAQAGTAEADRRRAQGDNDVLELRGRHHYHRDERL